MTHYNSPPSESSDWVPPKKKLSDIGLKTRSAKRVKRRRETERQLRQGQPRECKYREYRPERRFYMPHGGYSRFGDLWCDLPPEDSLTEQTPESIEVKMEPLVKLEPSTMDDGAESTLASDWVTTEMKVEPGDADDGDGSCEVLEGQVDSFAGDTNGLLLACGYKPVEMLISHKHYKNGRKYKLYQCPYCDYRSHSSGVTSHIGKHTNYRQFGCDVCEFRTNYRTALERHARAHGGKTKAAVANKKYECDQCGYVTRYGHHFKTHMTGKHSADAAFNCDVCEYSTKYARSLRRHVLSQHTAKTDGDEKKQTPLKKFKCEYCDYITAYRHALIIHLAMHSDEKPFKCVLCEYSTKYATSLRRHKQTMHVAQTAIFFASSNERDSVASENIDDTASLVASSNKGSSVASGEIDNLMNNYEPECIVNDKEYVDIDPLQI